MLKDGRFTVYSISLIPFVTRGHELPAAVQKDWTADQNFPRSLILFETVKHFLTFFFSTTKPDSVILYATQTDIAEESFHVHVVIFDEMLQGNTVENTCEMSNSIGFLVGKNFRSLKWFMTKKFTNIALQTSIEIKNYYVRSTAFFASSKSVSVYTVDRKINGLVFKSLSDYNQFQYVYISVSRKLF